MRVDVDTHSVSILEFETGALGSMTMSFERGDSETPRFEIYGTQGTICIPDPIDEANDFHGPLWYRTRQESRWEFQPRPNDRPVQWIAATRVWLIRRASVEYGRCRKTKAQSFGYPDQVLSRGRGHGISVKTERLVRTGSGFPEGLIEAWANLYAEFALAVPARREGLTIPSGWLEFPQIGEGVDGVKFIQASVRSNGTKDSAKI